MLWVAVTWPGRAAGQTIDYSGRGCAGLPRGVAHEAGTPDDFTFEHNRQPASSRHRPAALPPQDRPRLVMVKPGKNPPVLQRHCPVIGQ